MQRSKARPVSHDRRQLDALRSDRAAGRVAAGRANQSESDHDSDGAIARWVVGIAIGLAVLWATYVLLSAGERVRAGADGAVDTAPVVGQAASNLTAGDVG
jgi:hypothetical protein